GGTGSSSGTGTLSPRSGRAGGRVRSGSVSVSGGRNPDECPVRLSDNFPPLRRLEVVVAAAERMEIELRGLYEPIGQGRVVFDDVVEVAVDRGLPAAGERTAHVPCAHRAIEDDAGAVRLRPEGSELAVGVDDQGAPGGVGRDTTGHVGGDGPVTRQFTGLVVHAEQRARADRHLDLGTWSPTGRTLRGPARTVLAGGVGRCGVRGW